MRKTVLTAWLIACFCATATADRLILTEGRELEGIVTVEEDSVLIVTEHARLRFPKDQVLRIELKDLPKVELAKRLAAVSKKDPDALFSVARWALKAGLRKDAEKIIADVLKLHPDHPAARAELGQVKIDGKWQPFDKAVELARSKMEAEQFDLLLTDILPGLEKLAAPRGKVVVIGDLIAHAQLRAKKFAAAAETFAGLAEKAKGSAALRYSAIAAILSENADGMYVLREPYPPGSRLLGGTGRALQAGPASLANPLALEAALRDRAKKEIQAGQELMDAARKLERSSAAGAHSKYQQASRVFERADALVEDIARSYRVEIVRRRMHIIRKSYREEASKYDAILKTLGTSDMSASAYRQKVQEMIRRVNNIRGPLEEMLALARPYPEDLFLEVQWAESDLKTIKALRDILTEALNGKG